MSLEAFLGLKQEMDRTKEYAWCCAPGVNDSNHEFSMWTARERIQEAEDTGAEAIVTACPWCVRNFDDAIKENGSSLKIYDITELLAMAIL
jgi:Fe-S oxidoreductase